MNRKYIDDLGIKHEDTPQGWNLNDLRQEEWKTEQKIYGFDERETWSLSYSFKLWLYERLSMYNEVNGINTSFHKFEYKDETLTQQDCINRILEGLKYDLTLVEFSPEWKKHEDKINDMLPLFVLCFDSLWW